MNTKMIECGDSCPVCGQEMVEISAENLKRSRELLRPTIHSIPAELLKEKRSWYPICPQCDEYALGADMVEGIPFRCRDGRIMTIPRS